MPLYIYECPECQSQQEELAKSYETAVAPHCSDCNKVKVRVMGETHFRLVGKDWTGSVYSRYRNGMKDPYQDG